MDSPWIAGVGLSSRCPVRGSDSKDQRFYVGEFKSGRPVSGQRKNDANLIESFLA